MGLSTRRLACFKYLVLGYNIYYLSDIGTEKFKMEPMAEGHSIREKTPRKRRLPLKGSSDNELNYLSDAKRSRISNTEATETLGEEETDVNFQGKYSVSSAFVF